MKLLKQIFVILLIIQQMLANDSVPNDFKQGPCEDFYEYACRNYSYENTYPLYSEITQKLDYDINVKLLRHLETLLRQHINMEEQNYKDKMLIYYKSCKWETRRNIAKYLKEVKPAENLNWPLLQQTNGTWLKEEENFDLWSLLGKLQSYGLNSVIIEYELYRNQDNTLSIWLAPPQQAVLPNSITTKVLLKTLGLKNEQKIMQELNVSNTNWQNLLKQYEGNPQQEEVFTYENLSQVYKPLKLYLQALLDTKELENISFISIENPEYFKFIMENQWSNKNLEHIINYLMLQFLYFLAVDSTAEYNALECIKDTRNKFDLAVNYISYHYLYRYNSNSFQSNYTLLENLKKTMSKYFQENHLNLSPTQIKFLTNKLHNIKINIGNLPLNCNYNTVNNFYRDIEDLDANNYYKNHLLLLKHLFRKSLLNQQNQTFYPVTNKNMAGTSSPFYITQFNMVIIPIGSFQKPLFHYHNSQQLEQIALFGFVLAHEMGHAFDTTGLKHDHHGYSLTNTLNIETHENFTRTLECMQLQEPTDEIDERIADFIGVRVAFQTFADYYAYNTRNWQKDFFLNMAQFFCGKSDLTFIDHDADPIRLNSILKNYPAFARVFRCPLGSPMNPRNKCRLY